MDEIYQTAIDILTPVIESSMVLASHYAKTSGRDVVTQTDLEYALKYTAQHEVGTHIGSLFPEVYDDSDSDESLEVVSDDDVTFVRYSGDDEWCNKMNRAFDTWDTWTPSNPLEIMIRNSIENLSKKI